MRGGGLAQLGGEMALFVSGNEGCWSTSFRGDRVFDRQMKKDWSIRQLGGSPPPLGKRTMDKSDETSRRTGIPKERLACTGRKSTKKGGGSGGLARN